MKSYLSIIPASVRVRRKQNRMINMCIILAVFLVTTIFSLADSFLRSETTHTIDVSGYWHICLSGIQEGDAESIAMRSDVARSSRYDVINLDEPWKMDKDYYIEGAQTALCGIDETFVGNIMHYFSDGAHVSGGNDIILTENAQELLDINEGDVITLNTPAGDHAFTVSGFRISGNGKYVGSDGGQESALLVKDSDLRKGSDVKKEYGDSHCVLTIWDRDIPLEIGDKISVSGEELEIAGMLKYNPFSNDGGSGGVITVITSEETFTRLTGITDYVILDVQMESKTLSESDKAVEEIRRLSKAYEFRDRRDEAIQGFYYMLVIFVYGFVAIVALIALLNIVNSISMSVSARINQYGSMRAIGMSLNQVIRMVAAEAFTYALCGCAAGFAIGLPLSKFMYGYLVTSHFYYFTWSVPVMQIVIVLLFVLVSILAAIYMPARRLRDMSVTDTIRAQ